MDKPQKHYGRDKMAIVYVQYVVIFMMLKTWQTILHIVYRHMDTQ